MNELTTFYTQLLESAGLTIDKETGGVFLPYGGTEVTVKIDGKDKPLVIPYHGVLRNAEWCDVIGFHPTCESSYAGQSQVLNVLLKVFSMTYHEKLQELVGTIITLWTQKGNNDSFPLPLLEYFSEIGEISPAVEKLFTEIVKKNTGISGAYPLLSFRLHRGGSIDDELFSRTCNIVPTVVTTKLFGTTNHSIKGRETLLKIYESLLPEKLIYGSNHNSMPYLMVLMVTFYNAMSKLNKINFMLGKYSKTEETSLLWYKNITKLGQWGKLIPQVLRGNVGDPIKVNSANKPTTGVDLIQPELLQVKDNVPNKEQIHQPSVYNQSQNVNPQVQQTGHVSMEERLRNSMQGRGNNSQYPTHQPQPYLQAQYHQPHQQYVPTHQQQPQSQYAPMYAQQQPGFQSGPPNILQKLNR